MKFYVNESCLYEGEHLEGGQVHEISKAGAAALYLAGRGYSVADAPAKTVDPEQVTPAKPKK